MASAILFFGHFFRQIITDMQPRLMRVPEHMGLRRTIKGLGDIGYRDMQLARPAGRLEKQRGPALAAEAPKRVFGGTEPFQHALAVLNPDVVFIESCPGHQRGTGITLAQGAMAMCNP